MSYPYELDLIFGSERSSVDSITNANLSEGVPFPTTQAEIDALVQRGLAYSCTIYPCDGSIIQLDPDVMASLPNNLKGIACVMDNEVISLSYEIYEGEIYVGNAGYYYNNPIYVILKHTV